MTAPLRAGERAPVTDAGGSLPDQADILRAIRTDDVSDRPAAAEAATEDAKLVARIRAGDLEAFDHLVRTYYGPVRSFVLGQVGAFDMADELTQDLFVRLWEKRGSWHLRYSLRTYLFAAGRNAVLVYQRHARVVERGEAVAVRSEMTPGMGAPNDPADRAAHSAELYEAVRRCVAALPDRARHAVTLRLYHDLTYPEIAATMGITVKAVERLLARAFHSLRDQLGEFAGE